MLEHAYTYFDKSKYAGLTSKIGKAAMEGDPMCGRIMYDAGYALGRHISALSRNIDPVGNKTGTYINVIHGNMDVWDGQKTND